MTTRHVTAIAATVLLVLLASGGLVWGGAGWSGEPYALNVSDHITAPGQSRDGSLLLTLDHDVPCTVSVSVSNAGDEVLTCAGDALTTRYKLTGAALQNPDTAWVGSSDFLTRTYTVPGTGPSDQIMISVQAIAAADRANNVGAYAASVVLTASW